MSNRHTFDRLETIEWGERHFGSLTTNRQFPRRAMLRLVASGLVRCVGFVELCDGDGFHVEPTREAVGYRLTDAGKAFLADWRATHCAMGCDRPPVISGLCASCATGDTLQQRGDR